MSIDEIKQLFKDHPIEAISLLVALAASFFSYKSFLIAKRALSFTQKDYNSKLPNFDLYYIDGFRWKEPLPSLKNYLLFNITIYNKSQSKSSYKANLHIEYIKPDNSLIIININHQPGLSKDIPKLDLSLFPDDIRIEEKGSDSKWLIFEGPNEPFNTYRISKFKLEVLDINNISQTAEIFLIKDIENASQKK